MYCAYAQPSVVVSRRIAELPGCLNSSDFEVCLRGPLQVSVPGRSRVGSFLKRERKTLSFLERNLNPRRWGQGHECRAQVDAGGVEIDSNDTRKDVFEVVVEHILKEDDIAEGKGFNSGAFNGGSTTENGAKAMVTEAEEKTKTKSKPKQQSKSKEQDIDWENVPTMPYELDLAQRHPIDPHKPNFSELLPEPLRPYPSFEGWFVRIWDPKREFSAAVILATNYATDESQVTLLFAPGKDVNREGDRDSVNYGYTYAVAAKSKDAKFMRKENDEEWGYNRGEKPEGFEWEANGIGRIIVTPHVTDLDFTVEGYNFKAHLTEELLWDAHKSDNGPEGWAQFVSIIPTHWYVYSLGSAVEYTFSNPDREIHSGGSAFGHMEKNWGQTFPAGHVWMQAFNDDNTTQVCCSGAYFGTPGEKLRSPYLFVLGYRSPKLQLDFRTNDLGIVFKDMNIEALDSRFSITAVGPSHTVEIMAYAPYDTFSDPVLAPVTKIDWEPACRESFLAEAEIKVYEHLLWGIPGTENLVETSKFKFAALEFGEDLIAGASKGNQN